VTDTDRQTDTYKQPGGMCRPDKIQSKSPDPTTAVATRSETDPRGD